MKRVAPFVLLACTSSYAADGPLLDADQDGVDGAFDVNDSDPCIPLDLAGPCDRDGDGLTNEREVLHGTDIDDVDSDDDGLCDGSFSVPGLCAGGEDVNGDGIVGALESDPANPCDPNDSVQCLDADLDGDGVVNGEDIHDINACIPSLAALPCDQDFDGLTNATEHAIGSDETMSDTDRDGILDGDENLQGTDPLWACEPSFAADSCDQEGDGLTNLEELLLGTDPVNPDSDGDSYDDGAEIDGFADPLWACSPFMDNDACDQEGDGLTNAEERQIGTDPANPDSDGDTYDDGAEIDGFADPLDPCDPRMTKSACDQEGDGLTNAEELVLGTNPTDPDSDHDGVVDGAEMLLGANPLDACSPAACTQPTPEVQVDARAEPTPFPRAKARSERRTVQAIPEVVALSAPEAAAPALNDAASCAQSDATTPIALGAAFALLLRRSRRGAHCLGRRTGPTSFFTAGSVRRYR